MFGTIITIIVVILGIAFSVALHELGHMLPAKAFKVPVTWYMIGFGPVVWSKKFGETEYGVKAILLGGSTKIVGMFPQKPEGHQDKWFKSTIEEVRSEAAKEITPENEARAFYNLTFGKKLLVMAGGTLTNLLLGFICFLIAFGGIGTYVPSPTIAEVGQGAPAAVAGIEAGDTIIRVNGKDVKTFADVSSQIASADGDLTIGLRKANGGEKQVTVKPEEKDGRKIIGITSATEKAHYSVGQVFGLAGNQVVMTVKAVSTLPVQLWKTAISTVKGEARQGGLVSVIGVGQMAVAGEKQADGFAEKAAIILSILGSLNIGLFVLNLIPLLPLDGGHSLNAIYEGAKRGVAKIRRKPRPGPADLARSMPVGVVMWGFLVLSSVVLILADIINPIV